MVKKKNFKSTLFLDQGYKVAEPRILFFPLSLSIVGFIML